MVYCRQRFLGTEAKFLLPNNIQLTTTAGVGL